MGKLTAKEVENETEEGRYHDGDGLYLQVSKHLSKKTGEYTISKSWLFRYQLNKRPRELGLGGLKKCPLKKARADASKARAMLGGLEPIDPMMLSRRSKRQAEITARGQRMTFKTAAESYIATHSATWTNPKHRVQWPSTMKTYVYPLMGQKNVAEIGISDVLTVLEPIWTTKNPTATRVRGRVEKVLNWAKARHLRTGDNPASWQALETLLPAKGKVRKVQHQPALPYLELPSFMAELRKRDSVSARALEWTILTAARTGATIGARWDEIDFANKTWTVPGSRAGTKLRQDEHRVPLSQRAIEILKGVPREKDNPHIFVGSARKHKRGGLSDMALLELLKGMRENTTTHGFRSTFKDWASEATNYADIVSEMALAHVVKDEVQAAYRRGELLSKRARLMNDWAGYCAQPPRSKADNVRSIRSVGP